MQNWLDYYEIKHSKTLGKRLTTKTGFLGLWGERVDALEYYTAKLEELSDMEAKERESIVKDPNAIMPAAFVSFKTRWGAAVCAQTQQTSNPTLWVTEWAPEPRDVYWPNLSIPFVRLTIRRLIMAVALFFLTFFFMIPIAFVQSLASIEGIEKVAPFLRHIIEIIPRTVGVAIPLKATFFITYVMVDGWAGIAAEILRVKPLVMFHLKNTFLVKTEQDRDQAMDPGSLEFASSEPRIQFYFLLGFVYAVVTPILLPFIVVFFGFAFAIFRHQIINVYNQGYESGAAFWPDVHGRIISAMIISQFLLMGLMASKRAAYSTPLILALPVLTIWFHSLCKSRFEPAFVKLSLQDAMVKDTLERATDPAFDLKAYLRGAYIHPVFKDDDIDRHVAIDEEENNPLVRTKRGPLKSSSGRSKYSSEAGSNHEL